MEVEVSGVGVEAMGGGRDECMGGVGVSVVGGGAMAGGRG